MQAVEGSQNQETMMSEQLKEDLKTLKIDEDQTLTVKYVTAKYRQLAKEKHPDREGGITSEFQDLQNAYRRIISFIEDRDGLDQNEEDFEKEFFMQHNMTW